MEHFQKGEVKTPKKTINGSRQVRILQMDADFRACTWRKDMVNTCKRPGYHKARGLSLALEVNHQFSFWLMINPYLRKTVKLVNQP